MNGAEPVKPLPAVTVETQPFWRACAAGTLLYQQCKACGRVQFYPRTVCARCRGPELDWKPSGGKGAIYTYTVVHRAPSAAFKADVPYAIALVDLEEGFRIMVNVLGCDPGEIRIGMPVAIGFERRGDDGVHVPQAYPRRD